MKTSIEEINGRKCTVVWHDCFSGEVELAMKRGYWKPLNCGFVLHNPQNGNCDAIALPALPRHPKPEDAPKLMRCIAEGLRPVFEPFHEDYGHYPKLLGIDEAGNALTTSVDRYRLELIHISLMKIAGALDPEGNRISIAIEKGEL